MRSAGIAMTLLALLAVSGCSQQGPGLEERELASIDAALDSSAVRFALFVEQQRFLEALDRGEMDDIVEQLDLGFRFVDYQRPPAGVKVVGDGYDQFWRERPGSNYYQFVADGIPDSIKWTGRTMEAVWVLSGQALLVAHVNERNPLFTEWVLRDDQWKVARLTVNAPDSALHSARASRQ